MTPVHIADSRPIGAPADWDIKTHGKCDTIHVRTVVLEGLQFMQSGYEPTPPELALLNAGGKLILGINCRQHPVIHMFVDEPPFDPDVKPLASYSVAQEIRGNARWCVVTGIFGRHSFPAAMEMGVGVTIPQASSRLITAIEHHAKEQKWI